jgi:hypothetical protein
MEAEEGGRRRPALRYADTPYKRWQKGEGIAIHTGAYIEDLHTAEVSDWPRVGQKNSYTGDKPRPAVRGLR